MDLLGLTPNRLEELYQDLEHEQLRLEENLQLTREGSRPVQVDQPIGRLTRMDAIQQQQLTKASRATLVVKLSQVRASLEAYHKGQYGYCRSCREPIGYARLKARPEAPFCLDCQDTRET